MDIFQIVRYYFNEWNEENLDPKIITAEIYNNLNVEIMSTPDLCVLISYNMQKRLIDEFNSLQKQLGDIRMDLSNIKWRTDSSYQLLQQIVNDNLCNTKNIKNMLHNNKFIPLTYQNYFIRPLFLEQNMNDKKIATLSDVYIENKFIILDFEQQNANKKYTGIIQFIEDFIKENLRSVNYGTTYSFGSKHIKVLFIKGHPGSGKSSLFYYLAYLKSHDRSFLQNYNFYFAKLTEIFDANDGKLNIQNPIEDLQNQIKIDLRIQKNIVLVLDGLDEICVVKNFDINEYCYNLVRITHKFQNLKIIITTRLNYIKISHNDNKNVFNIQLSNLDINDLKNWITKYFNIHNTSSKEKKLAEINVAYMEKNENRQIIEILAVPLLFYMIVVSGINVSKITSIGELYDQIFGELKKRNYNKAEYDFEQKHGINSRIPEKLARQIAIEISKEMYSKNTLLLKVNSKDLRIALNRACSIEYNFDESDKKEIEKLFPITFFYKESIDAVEFAHKSIMEFFVAEKLYQILVEFTGELNEYIDKYMLNPIITNEVLTFMSYFIDNRKDSTEIIEKYSDVLSILRVDIYQKTSYSNQNLIYSFELSKIVFKIYWYFIRNIIKCKSSDINELIDEDVIRRYIISILSIRDFEVTPFLNNSIIVWNFKQLIFKNYNFFYCNLEFADFSHVNLEQCIFKYSNLEHVNFDSVVFKGYTLFMNCNMNYAKIKNLEIDRGIKKQKYMLELRGVSLDDTEFDNVDFRKINIKSIISMEKANIKNVKLNLEQLMMFCKFNIICENLMVYISMDDLERREVREIEKWKKENFEKNLNEYINNIIIKKIKKNGVLEEITTNLTIILNENSSI